MPRIVFLLEFLYVRVHFLVLRSLQQPALIFLPGRDHDYQTLNLTFAVNVVKFGLIIGMFPKPLKPCVVPSICVKIHMPFSLKSTLVLCHACYRTFPPRFDRKLNSSDLSWRSDLQRWRSMERTGMTSRFVGSLYPNVLSHYTDDPQNDMLMWLMSEAKGVERSLEGVALRLLLINFASIHSTSLASHGLQFPPVMRSYSLYVHRLPRVFCTAFSPIPNFLNLSAKRSTP